MQLTQQLAEFVRACFTGLWIESHEHQDALVEIAQLCRQEDWQLATWDVNGGLTLPGNSNDDNTSSDPLAVVRAAGALATPDGTTLLVLQNFHRFLQSPEIVQAVAMSEQAIYTVHLFPVVRVTFETVRADSPRQAVDQTRDEQFARFYKGFESADSEFNEDIAYYLVDVAGDEDFSQSQWFENELNVALGWLKKLIAWDDCGRTNDALLAEIVAAARDMSERAI